MSSSGSNEEASPRARLYARLPVTEDAWWFRDLAAVSPDRSVLELGAGTGRLTRVLAEVSQVVAVDSDETALAMLAGTPNVTITCADVRDLYLGRRFGLVLAPVSLLNEIPDESDRVEVVRRAAAHCRPDGLVVFQLLNPFWLMAGEDSHGVIEGVDGTTVALHARHEPADLWRQRARAELRYRFSDGTEIVDRLEAAAVFPQEFELMAEAAGLAVVESWGAVPGDAEPAMDDGGWTIVTRPAGRGSG